MKRTGLMAILLFLMVVCPFAQDSQTQAEEKAASQTQENQTQSKEEAKPEEKPAPVITWRTYESAEGGFSIEIPDTWFEKVVTQPGVYQGFLSREEIGEAGRNFQTGISFMRINDYTRAYKFNAKNAGDIGLEFANRIAGNLGKDGNAVVMSLSHRNFGKDLYIYQLIANGDNSVCTNILLLVGVWKKQMFYAMLEMPCSEQKTMYEHFQHMKNSLVVKKKWKAKK